MFVEVHHLLNEGAGPCLRQNRSHMHMLPWDRLLSFFFFFLLN